MDTRQKLSERLREFRLFIGRHAGEEAGKKYDTLIAQAEAIEAASHQGRGEGKVWTESEVRAMFEAGDVLAKYLRSLHGSDDMGVANKWDEITAQFRQP